MKKRSLSIVLLIAVLLSCLILPSAFAEGESTTDYDALAVAEGYHFRVGTAEEAYDNGAFTGYFKYSEMHALTKGAATKNGATVAAPKGKTLTLICDVDTGTTGFELRCTFTLDGNGHTISGARNGTLLTFSTYSKDCTVKNLTVVNAGFSGDKGAVAIQFAGGTTTLDNVTLQSTGTLSGGKGTARVQKDATVVLKNGSKIISDVATDDTHANYAFNIEGANAKIVIEDGCTITTKGTTFGATVAGSISIKDSSINGAKLIDTAGNATFALDGTVKFNGKTIYSAPTAETIKTLAGSLYLAETDATRANSGITFQTNIDKTWLDALTNEYVTVEAYTMILPASLLENGDLTDTAKARTKNLRIANDGYLNSATIANDSVYSYAGGMVGLSDTSLASAIAGVGYVTITIADVGTYTFWAVPAQGTIKTLAEAYDATSLNEAQQSVLAIFKGTN